MENQILLSIVMPTYNRCDMLRYTLSLLEDQVRRNATQVELIICDNASTDNTFEMLNALSAVDSFFKLIHYDKHEDIGESIRRSIENANGRYFLLWSDDDIPSPTLVDVCIKELIKFPDIECITFNRVQGYSKRGEFSIHQCKVMDSDYVEYEQLYENGCDFVRERWRGMTFLSADLVSVRAWKKGLELYPNNHLGWEFLAPVLYGISRGRCLYLNYPLCIQRWLYQPGYRVKWASYIYIGIPRILETLQNKGVVSDWRYLYDEYLRKGQFNTTVFGYAFNMIYWASFDKKYYKPLIKDINHYQRSFVNKMLTYGVLIPDFILVPFKYLIKRLFILMGKRNYV